MAGGIRIGFPRMRKERGEMRDFLPRFIAEVYKRGAIVVLEQGYGSGMGLQEHDYREACPHIEYTSHDETYRQPYVLVLRYPNEDEIALLQPGACLISMIHYATRPQRVTMLRSMGVEAISLDSIKDDSGRRMVENLRAVAWNGMEVAFETLEKIYPAPGFRSPDRPPIHVTLLGAGAVGSHVVLAAIRYGNEALRKKLVEGKIPGVEVKVIDYDLSNRAEYMKEVLRNTDILIDATQRPDSSRPVIPNDWISWLPQHALILDLAVDPYDESRSHVKGIEGIPHGNLDQFIFAPDDPAYNLLPPSVQTKHRRYAVSCYSWPGLHPQRCMLVYGGQLLPLIRKIIEKGGIDKIDPQGTYFERALSRAQLSRWP